MTEERPPYTAETVATADGPRLQSVLPGAERSAHQLQKARDGKIRRGPNRPCDVGLFGPAPEPELF